MTSTALKNSQPLTISRPQMSKEDRKAASELLDAAMTTDNPETAMRLRVVAALLHGQDIQKIRRNLSVSEKAIQSYKAQYDRNGIRALVFQPTLV
ncbi:helix-turn-helix domain-containing protein [Agrobacterium rubi]|nr:helix-turn-helix domain-containing protein [Agrobacterium rubi]NTF25193.1 helix-turn-helix domain-containing protein [Agrobacterium rubi]